MWDTLDDRFRGPERAKSVIRADTIPAIELSRRETLRLTAAGVAGGAVAAWSAGCGGGGDKVPTVPTISPEQAKADAAVMNSLLDLERTAVLAYTVGQDKLSGAARRAMRTLLAQEKEHEHAIERAVLSLGVHPIRARPAAQYTSGFPPLASAGQVLRFALDVENTQVSAYGDSLGTIVTPELRATIASILATEAEHMAVVLGALHEPQAAQALVTGNAPA
jgi:rubrerythrin